ncbi:MAG: hypothetical protein GWP64_14885 [Gammaproteobacteria bacterium]|nr:hypothetical protein [Gammaproteobacteria bacterium]
MTLMIALGQVAAAFAQESGGDFNVYLNPRTLRVQAKAEDLFVREEYQRAYTIYLNELAPIGDKYAQYMLGYMSLSGLGVEEDPVLASAWYRLAAERGEPEEFVRIRDDLLGSLDAPGRERSDQVLLDLRREYSDIAISMREARKEFENLSQVMTGTRLGDTSSAVTIVEPRAGNDLSVDELNYRIQRRMQRHLDNVTEKLGIERIDAKTVTAAEIEALEASVREHLL